MADIESIVVGAGVIGLATARQLALGGQEVMVLEQYDLTGSETSARNSGVIHAGIYYPPGSIRARVCVAGKKMLYDFCAENGVDTLKCGKLLVATTDAEIPRLEKLKENAEHNGVDDLVMLTAQQAKTLEPQLACVAACLSPGTGVVDGHGLIKALEGHIESNGGNIVLSTRVTAIRQTGDEFRLEYVSGDESGSITCRQLVLASGHGGTRLGNDLKYPGDYQPPRTFPAKGHYFQLNGASPFRHLIYPMPDGAWLGTHLTLDTTGKARFGPDNQWVDHLDYQFDDDDGRRKQQFVAEIQRYWPGIESADLSPDYTGIRPKIYQPGQPPADFAIHGPSQHGLQHLVSLYGIESPGLTSSLAIAELVANCLRETV